MKGREDHVVVAAAKVPCKETGLPLVSLTTVGTGYDEHPSREAISLTGVSVLSSTFWVLRLTVILVRQRQDSLSSQSLQYCPQWAF